jgi:hypothetical protein
VTHNIESLSLGHHVVGGHIHYSPMVFAPPHWLSCTVPARLWALPEGGESSLQRNNIGKISEATE